jgi:LysM repeat protein
MRINLYYCFFAVVLFFKLGAIAQLRNNTYLLYIEQYHDLAQKQQAEYGIPASITLAQGLLESNAGEGSLAKISNNHFGIKCSDWAGEKIYYDDDAKGECFRKYTEVIESYEDHSLFLKSRPRYAFLFSLDPTDYAAWAFGLKKAGYATNPIYAEKLISIIENYELNQYDSKQSLSNRIDKEMSSIFKNQSSVPKNIIPPKTHTVLKVNEVLFVNSVAGDSYASIAAEFKLTESAIREFNELSPTVKLQSGTRVFIEEKKTKAPKEFKTHIVQSGETMHSIAQDYGMKVLNLYELNEKSFDEGAKCGEELKLRKHSFL